MGDSEIGRILITQGDKKQSGQEKSAIAKPAPASLTLAMEPLSKGEDTHFTSHPPGWTELRKSISQARILNSPQLHENSTAAGCTDRGCLLDIWTQRRYPHYVPHQAGQTVGTGQAWLAAWGLDEGPRGPGEELELDSFKQRSDRTHLFYLKDQSTARSVDCIQERKHGAQVGGQTAATGTWNRCWQWRGRSVDTCILETVDVRCENGGVTGLSPPAGGAAWHL